MIMNEVSLRALEPEDLDVLYRIENDRELWDVGVTNVPYSRYLLHNYISQATGDIYADGQVRLMIEHEGTVVGIADLVNFDARNLRAEVGLVIEASRRRQGYALDSLRQLASYAQQVLHLHQLYAIIGEDNSSAIALFEKAGYKKTAEMPEWLFDGHSYRSAFLLQKIL